MPRPKIEVPRIPPSSLSRSRLLDVLAGAHAAAADGNGAGPRVVDVCAPAGYGKTTLLATYARQLRDEGTPVAWVGCDRHDNDPTLLWSALLQSIAAELSETADGAAGRKLAAMTPPQHEMEPAFLAEFVEAIDELPGPIVLVLDDVHELVSNEALAALDELLRNPPGQMLLFLGCRFDPPLALPRLRVDGRLREVRAADLSFTEDEVRSLLATHDVALADDGVAAFVATFAGDQRGVADYLVAEVLSRQPQELREFLMTTSVAEELPVELAITLSGRDDAGAILHRLERANALVTRVGRGRGWYRCHALLRGFLLTDLRSRDAAEARRLHARASDWFADADMPDAALEHAVAADEGDRVVDLLRRFGLRQLLSGAGATVRDVLATASRRVADTPEATLIGGVDALERGDLAGADRLLASVNGAVPDDDPWLIGLHAAAQLYQARMHGDATVLADPSYDRAASQAADALGATRIADDHDVNLLILSNSAALRIATGDYTSARSDASDALDIALRSRRDYLALQCMNQLSAIAGALGELPTTMSEAQRAISFAAGRGWGSSPRMAYAYTLAAWAAYQTLDLTEAARRASNAVNVMGGAMTPEVEAAVRFAEAVIAFDRPPDRHDALQRMRQTWTAFGTVEPSPALAGYAGMAELHMCLTLGEHTWARAAVERIERLLGPDGDAAAMQAVLLCRSNRVAQARRAIAPLLRDGPCATVITNDITGWLVEAVAADTCGEPRNAHTAVMSALELAAPIDALRPFYDMGDPVRQLLINTAGRLGRLDAFAATLLDAWSSAHEWQDHHAGSTNTTGNRLAGGYAPHPPLTLRELEILRNLPSMLTTEEIAEAHVVSINTVKTHLKSIYRKLGVNSRREAVETGRLAGIL
jgi:LuxR family maltose regulon positive regulatory protein